MNTQYIPHEEQEREDITYPYIGKHMENDTIVLFTDPFTGTCLVKGDDGARDIHVGLMGSDWLEKIFEPLDPNDKVILQNSINPKTKDKFEDN